MGYNQFKINILLRIAAITFSAFLLADFINESFFQLSTLLIIALLIFQIVSLLKFLQVNRQTISQFINDAPEPVFTAMDSELSEEDLPDEALQVRYQQLQQKKFVRP